MKITRTGVSGADGMHEYDAEIVIDRGENVQFLTTQLWHARDEHNVMALIARTLSSLRGPAFLLDGKIDHAAGRKRNLLKILKGGKHD